MSKPTTALLIATVLLILAMTSACDGESRRPDCDPTECGTSQPCGDDGRYDYDGDGYASDRDCDETSEHACEINPGMSEVCDGHDNNCDGNVDGADDRLEDTEFDTFEFYIDRDCDGYASKATRRLCIDDVTNQSSGSYFTVHKNGEVAYNFHVPSQLSDSHESPNDTDDYTDIRRETIAYYLSKGHERLQLGEQWHDYFDTCDFRDDDGCETDSPQCEYSDAIYPYTTDVIYAGMQVIEECIADPDEYRTCAI